MKAMEYAEQLARKQYELATDREMQERIKAQFLADSSHLFDSRIVAMSDNYEVAAVVASTGPCYYCNRKDARAPSSGQPRTCGKAPCPSFVAKPVAAKSVGATEKLSYKGLPINVVIPPLDVPMNVSRGRLHFSGPPVQFKTLPAPTASVLFHQWEDDDAAIRKYGPVCNDCAEPLNISSVWVVGVRNEPKCMCLPCARKWGPTP